MKQLDDKGETEFTVNAYVPGGWNWQHSFTTRGEAESWARSCA